MHHYEQALAWAKTILLGDSPHCMYGDVNAFSLLFPMEAVFESFVTTWWMRYRYYDKWRVDAQVSSKNLISYNGKAFFIKSCGLIFVYGLVKVLLVQLLPVILNGR